MKTKIYVPNRAPYRFSSLEEAVVTLKKQRSGFKYYDLIDTVEYNVCYRDHLRQHGLDSLIERLLREALALGWGGGHHQYDGPRL